MKLFKQLSATSKKYDDPVHKTVAVAGFLTGWIKEKAKPYVNTFKKNSIL